MRTEHQWGHQLNHCIYCDLPFMEKTKCIKHEQESCKNTQGRCYKCGETFGEKVALMKHLVTPYLLETLLLVLCLGARPQPWCKEEMSPV